MENMQAAISLIPEEYHSSSFGSSTAAPPLVSPSACHEPPGHGPQNEDPTLEFPESWSDKSHDDEHVEPSSVALPACEDDLVVDDKRPVLGPEPFEVSSHAVEEVGSSPPVEPEVATTSVPEWTAEDIRRLCQYKDNESQRPRWVAVAENLNRTVDDVQKWAEIQRHRKTVSLPHLSPLKAPSPSKEKPSSSETGKKRRRKT